MAGFLSRLTGATKEIDLTISAQTFAKIVFLVLATFALLTFFHRTTYALTLLLVSLLLALALNAPVSWLAAHFPGRLRHNRGTATGVSLLLIISILVVFLLNVTPPIIHQTQLFITHLPNTVQDLRKQYRSVNEFVVRYHLQSQVDQVSNELGNAVRNGTTSAVTAVTGILSSLFSVLTVLVLTFMMVNEGPFWVHLLDEIVPARSRAHFRRLRTDMYKAARGYINGQIILALLASILVLPGLLIFHVSYPFALMAVVFLCGLIPMVGHTFGALIVAFVALFHSPLSAVGILIYYIAYQQVENYLVQPRLQANVTNLSPLLVFVALVIGVDFGGLVGGFAAIPLMACLRVLGMDYLQRHYDIEDQELPGVPAKRTDKENKAAS